MVKWSSVHVKLGYSYCTANMQRVKKSSSWESMPQNASVAFIDLKRFPSDSQSNRIHTKDFLFFWFFIYFLTFQLYPFIVRRVSCGAVLTLKSMYFLSSTLALYDRWLHLHLKNYESGVQLWRWSCRTNIEGLLSAIIQKSNLKLLWTRATVTSGLANKARSPLLLSTCLLV